MIHAFKIHGENIVLDVMSVLFICLTTLPMMF